MDAAAASEQSSVKARATAGNRVRVARRATVAEEEREGQQETCRKCEPLRERRPLLEQGALSGPELLPVRARNAEEARVAVARAGEVQEFRVRREGACVAMHCRKGHVSPGTLRGASV